MKLYHTPGSPPSRAVLMTIRNLNLEVDIEEIDLAKNEQNSPEFLKLNAAHQVPVLVDGDFVLAESRAIQAYLVNSRKPGSPLYPSDAKTRGIVDSRLYFDSTNVFGTLRASLGPMFFSGATEVSAENREKLKQALTCLNGFLEGKKYFAGDEPSIADISVVSNIIQAKAAFGHIGKYPNLEAWFKRCEKLPGFEENVNGAKCVQDFMKLKDFKLAPFE